VSLYGIGGILSLLLGGSKKVARLTSGWFGLIAAGLGVFAALKALVSQIQISSIFFLFRHLLVGTALGCAVSIPGRFNCTSWRWGEHIFPVFQEVTGFMGFLTNLFLATMLLVVTVNNAFFFMIFWEMMTLVTYLLVIWESDNEETMRTGYIYMLVAHIGAALILVAFLTLYYKTSSFDFGFWRLAWLPQALKVWSFCSLLLVLERRLGWFHCISGRQVLTPPPRPYLCLMASVMKKTAIYGFLRICIDIIGPIGWGWGFLVLVFGVLSAIIGAFYALTEKDLKRLLAYSSVEKCWDHFDGLRVGMIGISIQQPVISVLGFLAAPIPYVEPCVLQRAPIPLERDL